MLQKMVCLFALALASCALAQQEPDPRACERCAQTDCAYLLGINLAGPEFAGGELPGIEGRHFKWPNEASLDYWQSKGVRLIRLPFKWERLQPQLMGAFDSSYEEGLVRSIRWMAQRNMRVIPDVHNYAKYRGKSIGSEEVPVEAFADLWRRLAELLKDEPAIWGYGLMNEPAGPRESWQQAAQSAIDAIRAVDTRTTILVANDYAGWSASHAQGDLAEWAERTLKIPDPKLLRDPSNNLRFELHFYFDHTNAGKYDQSYEYEISRSDGPGARVSPEIGVVRMEPYLQWLERHNVKGFVGEYGGPANPEVDSRWLVVLDTTLQALRRNCMPSTLWAAGDAWTPGAHYVAERRGWSTKLEPEKRLRDRPQALLLQRYMDPPQLTPESQVQLEEYFRGEY